MVISLSNTKLQGKEQFCARFWRLLSITIVQRWGEMSNGQLEIYFWNSRELQKNIVSGNRVSRLVHRSRVCSVQSNVNHRHYVREASPPLAPTLPHFPWHSWSQSFYILSIFLLLFCLWHSKLLEGIWFLRLIEDIVGYNIEKSLELSHIFFP